MINEVTISRKTLDEITNVQFKTITEESTIHPLNNGNVLKLFKNSLNIDNKIKKIKLLHERLDGIDSVVIANSLVKCDDKYIGYTMPIVNGENFNCLNYNKQDTINILKKLSEELKKLHALGIVAADFHINFMLDKNKNIYLIDHDNFSIDNLPVDRKNIYLQTYEDKVKKFDKNFDNYLLNLFTISTLLKITTRYIYSSWDYIKSDDKEIANIIKNTRYLHDSYNEGLIIDKINNKKDIKKIKYKKY